MRRPKGSTSREKESVGVRHPPPVVFEKSLMATKYEFDVMKPGDTELVKCRVKERDRLLKKMRSLCHYHSKDGKKFSASAHALGVEYKRLPDPEPTEEKRTA